MVKEKKRVEFHILPGTEHGERIALRGEGDEMVRAMWSFSSVESVPTPNSLEHLLVVLVLLGSRVPFGHRVSGVWCLALSVLLDDALTWYLIQPEVPPGDIIFHIHILPHSTFRRLGDSHLGATVPLRLSEALLGLNRVLFVHLDGRGIRVESKRGERVIRHGEELCIRGEGMPRLDRDGGGKGDLRVRFEVEMPGASWAARLDAQVSTGGSKSTISGVLYQGGGVVEQMAKG